MTKSFEARLASWTAPQGECIVWTGGKDKDGYGLVFDPEYGKTRRAHRAVFERHNGKLFPGMLVCHSCDNPSCVQPSHLFQGTPRENTQDMLMKGRRKKSKRDTEHHATKIPHALRPEIREKCKSGISHTQVAKEYGVSQSLITQICAQKKAYGAA